MSGYHGFTFSHCYSYFSTIIPFLCYYCIFLHCSSARSSPGKRGNRAYDFRLSILLTSEYESICKRKIVHLFLCFSKRVWCPLQFGQKMVNTFTFYLFTLKCIICNFTRYPSTSLYRLQPLRTSLYSLQALFTPA